MHDEESDSSGLSPAAAFALVGHEHRVDILRALVEESRRSEEYPTSFATLFERTDVEVSSQFSYHLEELTGHFVRRTSEGYELRYAGWEIATSILAGTYNQRASFDPTPIGGTCPLCDQAKLEAAYREEWFSITCTACETNHSEYPLPPGAITPRSLTETLDVFDRHVRSEIAMGRAGTCPGCMGRMRIRTSSDDEKLVGNRLAICTCRRCGNRLYPPLGLFLLEDATVEKLFRERGRTLSEASFWELLFCVTDEFATVTATDPWECTFAVPVEDRTVTFSVDAELTVQTKR